jgi:hypothetical protein
MRTLLSVLAFAATSAAGVRGPAQATLVVPASAAATEANSAGILPGLAGRFRQQILISDAPLLAARGKAITGLRFRRDDLFGKQFDQSSAQLRVVMSRARRPVAQPSPAFADNAGLSPVVVFDGVVTLPANWAAPVPAPWTAPFTVEVPFSTAFPYSSGDICLDIEGTPINPPPSFFWWVDYEHEADVGSVTHLGTACGAAVQEHVTTAAASARALVPGNTMSVLTVGRPSSVGILMVGVRLTQPVSLAFLGAPGCSLYVQPLVHLPILYPATTISHGTFAATLLDIHIPAQSSLLGGRFAAQGLNLEPPHAQSNSAGLTTTNGLEIRLAGLPPAGTLSIVRSEAVAASEPFPTTGRVSVSRGPVMQLDYQ